MTFVGFWRAADPEGLDEYRRTHDDFIPPEFMAKTQTFPSIFDGESLKLIGSWATASPDAPGVIVVEADSFADLMKIEFHYQGWQHFVWHPASSPRAPMREA